MFIKCNMQLNKIHLKGYIKYIQRWNENGTDELQNSNNFL